MCIQLAQSCYLAANGQKFNQNIKNKKFSTLASLKLTANLTALQLEMTQINSLYRCIAQVHTYHHGDTHLYDEVKVMVVQ